MTSRPPSSPDIDPEVALEDGEAFETALAEDRGGTLAVIGQPFSGRERVLDRAEDRLDATRIRLTPTGDHSTLLEALGTGPVVVDGCQHLYRREIGGFETVRSVLGKFADTADTVITGWNSNAWSYLDAVLDTGPVLREQYWVSPLRSDELRALVESREGSLPTFRNDQRDDGILSVRRYALGDGERSLPLPVIDREALDARFGTPDDPEEAVFERLTDASNGNPGVAIALWERARDKVVRPSDITTATVDLDYQAAFVLRIVLTHELVVEEWLRTRVGQSAGRALDRLADDGILAREDGLVRLHPEGVPAGIKATERWRIL